MTHISITSLFTYPIKSSKGIEVDTINVLETGFDFDRHFAVINAESNIITARENPNLLQISSKINNQKLLLFHPKKDTLTVDISQTNNDIIPIAIFKEETYGKLINKEADQWLSSVLKETCRLIKIDRDNLRNIENTITNHPIAFSDVYPIHIVTTASIKALNNMLETPIHDNRFRPNILISGTEPFEEEQWKKVIIGNCEFDVVIPTERCSLITINPLTLERSNQQEPLRTLAKHKRGHKKVNFGIYLIPKKIGVISKNDVITILQ